MANMIPPDFDPAWYAARYPDVGLSGLSPAEHYRRFGRHLGRNVNGKAEPATTVSRSSGKPAAAPVELKPEPTRSPEARQPPPIIDRPSDLDISAQRVAPPPPAFDRDGPLSLVELAGDTAGDAITSYSRLLGLPLPNQAKGGQISCNAAPFQSGPTRIENAWFADRSHLRLMLAGNASAGSGDQLIRAYQATPASPAELQLVGPGIQLPKTGPVFHDLELVHPLMPVLIELSGVDGSGRRLALMPFPSLLAGGMHWAELKALQTETNPIDDFWAWSDALLRETIGQAGSPQRSLSSVSSEGQMDPAVAEWLAALFGSSEGGTGIELVVPADSVPTISAMASRNIDDRATSGPYLIADSESYRPRWSIVLANDGAVSPGRPILRGSEKADPSIAAQFPLAIALRQPNPLPARRSDDSSEEPGLGLAAPVSIVIGVSDLARTEALAQAVRTSAGSASIDWLIRLPDDSQELRPELDRIFGEDGWSAVSAGSDLRDVARDARNDVLLSIADQVRLENPEVLRHLCAMVLDDATIGSVSCALLGEKVIKRQVVLQPATGGLFPAGVSFGSSPRLSFWEPDVLQALPDQTYPVVANGLLLAAFRREALAGLPHPQGAVPATSADIRLGLDLIEAGFTNWCTTKVTTTLAGPYVRRDAIDPFGGTYAQPGLWEKLLTRVTLVRELL